MENFNGKITRKDIHNFIKMLKEDISQKKSALRKYQEDDMLFSDEKQWFTEKYEERIVSKRPKITRKILVGRVHWNEDFKDEGSGEVVTITRSRVVRMDGEWVD